MAIAAATLWEVRTAGNDTNGGGFVAGASGTDYSQQDSKNTVGSNISTTDAVAAGTTTITSATANFTAAIVGNIIYINAAWYQVTARASSTSITVDRNITTATGLTMNIGGAILSPAIVAANKVTGNGVWVKSGTYSFTSASTNIAGGCVLDSFAASSNTTFWEGYSTVRGDLGTPPVFQASGISTATLFTIGGGSAGLAVNNITCDGASLTAITGLSSTRRCAAFKVKVMNCTAGGINFSTTSVLVECLATNITGGTAALIATVAYGCESYGNTVPGFSVTCASYCIADSNSGASSDGFQTSSAEGFISNCVAYNNGRDGVRTSGETTYLISSIAENNAGFGFNCSSSDSNITLINCAGYNNTLGNVGTNLTGRSLGFQTGSSSFFVAAGSANFALNNTASAGKLARATGYPGVLPRTTTTGFSDIGIAQHAEIPTGSSSTFTG